MAIIFWFCAAKGGKNRIYYKNMEIFTSWIFWHQLPPDTPFAANVFLKTDPDPDPDPNFKTDPKLLLKWHPYWRSYHAM